MAVLFLEVTSGFPTSLNIYDNHLITNMIQSTINSVGMIVGMFSVRNFFFIQPKDSATLLSVQAMGAFLMRSDKPNQSQQTVKITSTSSVKYPFPLT